MNFVLELQRLMISNNYLIAIRDDFENLLVKSVLKITDEKIKGEPVEVHIKNRVFSVIVECVQNICSKDVSKRDDSKKDSILLLNRIQQGYQIVAGSRVDAERKKRLESLLTQLSKQNVEEIRTNWREVLVNRESLDSETQEKLTFIELYLRSNGNVKYYFDREEDNTYFFMVQVEITNE